MSTFWKGKIALCILATILLFQTAPRAALYADKAITKIASSAAGDTNRVTISMWATGRYDTIMVADTVYDTTRVPLDVTLAFDLSTSMKSTDNTTRWRITWAQISALRFLDSLKQGDRVSIFGWSADGNGIQLSDTANPARYLDRTLSLTSDISKARAFIRDSLYIDGNTRLTDIASGVTLVKQAPVPGLFDDTPLHISIIRGLKKISGSPSSSTKALIMLTDGENDDNVPVPTVTSIIDSIYRKDTTRLFTIGFNGGDAARLLGFAQSGGGSFSNATNPQQLDSIYAALARRLVNKRIDTTIAIKKIQVRQDTILPKVDAVLLFDNSGSMRQEIGAARQAGHDFVGMLGDSDRVALLRFDSWNNYQTIADFTPYNQFSSALNAMDLALTAGGASTAVWYGTQKAVQYTVANIRRGAMPAVVVLTDGQDNNSDIRGANMGPTPNAAFDSLMRFLSPLGTRIPVFTISLGNLTNGSQLETIARSTGGKYYLAGTGGELSAIYQDIARIIINNIGARDIRIVESIPSAYTYVDGSQAAGPSNQAPFDSMYSMSLAQGTTLVWTAPLLSVWDTVQGMYKVFVPKANAGDNLNQTLLTKITFENDDQHDSSIVFGNFPPSAPSLLSPVDYAGNIPVMPKFRWQKATTAHSYGLMISLSNDFSWPVVDVSGLTDTSYTPTVELSNLTKYYWRVNGTNSIGTGAWSQTWNFTTTPQAPGVPVLLSPAHGSAYIPVSTQFSWSPGSGGAVSFHQIQVSLDSAFTSMFFDTMAAYTINTIRVSGLAGSTVYYWRARATNQAGTSAWSEIRSFTTTPVLPSVPGLKSPYEAAVNQPITGLTLEWYRSYAAAEYQVEVSTSNDFISPLYSATIAASAVSFTLGTIDYQTTYYWRVRAANPTGASRWSYEVWSFTTISMPSDAPLLSSPANGSANLPINGLTLAWNASIGATAYRVEVSKVNDFSSLFLDTLLSAPALSILVQGMSNATDYYWRIGAVLPGQTTSWSGAWRYTTIVAPVGAPMLQKPDSGATNIALNPVLHWTPGAGGAPSSYRLQVSTTAGFASTITDTSLAAPLSNWLLKGLATKTTCFWRVKAINAADSAWSPTWSFTTVNNLNVPVSAGWNMISLNVHPVDSSADTILGALSKKTFVLMKNSLGEVYCPSLAINDIGSFRTGKGYQIYSGAADTIRVGGEAVDAQSTPLALPAGWSLIGYLPQSDMPIVKALGGIGPSILVVKNNAGQMYLPDYFIDDIGTMRAGEGYQIFTKSPTTLTYPANQGSLAKTAATERVMAALPSPRHYLRFPSTGNNASIVAHKVTLKGKTAPDSSEIGVFDENGVLVGSGSVLNGISAFSVWGDNPQTKEKDGCSPSEVVTFSLWDGQKQYPLEFDGGAEVRYQVDGIKIGQLSVPDGFFITSFALSRVYPNPIRRGNSVRIEFEVPMVGGSMSQNVEINVYNLKGELVTHLAKGKYKAGHYSLTWNGAAGNTGSSGSALYIIQMKARNFNQKIKICRIR